MFSAPKPKNMHFFLHKTENSSIFTIMEHRLIIPKLLSLWNFPKGIDKVGLSVCLSVCLSIILFSFPTPCLIQVEFKLRQLQPMVLKVRKLTESCCKWAVVEQA